MTNHLIYNLLWPTPLGVGYQPLAGPYKLFIYYILSKRYIINLYIKYIILVIYG